MDGADDGCLTGFLLHANFEFLHSARPAGSDRLTVLTGKQIEEGGGKKEVGQTKVEADEKQKTDSFSESAKNILSDCSIVSQLRFKSTLTLPTFPS